MMKGLTKLFILLIIIPAVCIPVVSSTVDLQNYIYNVTTNLAALQSHIEEKNAIGVDTTVAETHYNTASAQLASAKARPATQYSSAFNDVDGAQASIDAGETAVDKAWAEKDITDAQVPIDNAYGIITELRNNQSTVNDMQLAPIIAKREMAVNYISAANGETTKGNYSGARAMAQKAWQNGNESYTDAIRIGPKIVIGPENRWILLKMLLSNVPVLPIAAGIGAILVAIAAIVMRKTHK